MFQSWAMPGRETRQGPLKVSIDDSFFCSTHSLFVDLPRRSNWNTKDGKRSKKKVLLLEGFIPL